MFGRPNGRFGDAYLARVPENHLLNKTAYQYWDGAVWQTNNEAAAVPIVIAPVAELSVQFTSNFGRWIMTYFDERRAAIILRELAELNRTLDRSENPRQGQRLPRVVRRVYPSLVQQS